MKRNLTYAVIVTYNGEEWIRKCIDSLINSSMHTEIIIVDNGSNDRTIEIIENYQKPIILFKNKENLCFGPGNNIGIKLAIEKGADQILLLNQDAWVFPDTIEKLADFLDTNSEYGIISPIHLDGGGKNLDRYFKSYIKHESLQEIENSNQNHCKVKYINAAGIMITRKCIQKVGGFAPLFLHYGEDRDLCNRALYHKFEIGVLFTVKMCHYREYKTDNIFRKKHRLLLASGMAHLTNINTPLTNNLLSWYFQRFPKILRNLVIFKFNFVVYDFKVMYLLHCNLSEIIKSRRYSKETDFAYLNN